MTQKVIKEKLAKYMLYKAEDFCAELAKSNLPPNVINAKQKEIMEHAKAIADLLTSGGRCFAFSSSEAAFAATGYGEWWHEILHKVATWNPADKAKLNEKVDLRHLLPKKTDDPLPTLDQLFERVLNSILVEQARYEEAIKDFIIADQRQKEYFDESKSYFEITIDGQIKKAQSRDTLAGLFDTALLEKYLEENAELFEGEVCILHCEIHAMNLKYENKQWVVYDPNYSHEEKETMVKRFDKASDAVEEIRKQMHTSAFALELATIKPDKKINFNFYDTLRPSMLGDLLKGEGFNSIAAWSKKAINKIISIAADDESMLAELKAALSYQSKMSNWTGFATLTRYQPQEIPRLLKLAATHPTIADAIATSLFKSSDKKWYGLHYIINYAPDALPALFELANKNEKLKFAIKYTLDYKNINGDSPRSLMMKDPRLVMLAFKLNLPDNAKNLGGDIFKKSESKNATKTISNIKKKR